MICHKLSFVSMCMETKFETDNNPLERTLKKPLSKAPPRLQRYDVDVHCMPGKYRYLADTLPRAYIRGESRVQLRRDELSQIVHRFVLNISVREHFLRSV